MRWIVTKFTILFYNQQFSQVASFFKLTLKLWHALLFRQCYPSKIKYNKLRLLCRLMHISFYRLFPISSRSLYLPLYTIHLYIGTIYLMDTAWTYKNNIFAQLRYFSGEFKLKVLNYQQEHHLSDLRTALIFDITNAGTICAWRKKYIT